MRKWLVALSLLWYHLSKRANLFRQACHQDCTARPLEEDLTHHEVWRTNSDFKKGPARDSDKLKHASETGNLWCSLCQGNPWRSTGATRVGDALLEVLQGLVHDRTPPTLQWKQVSRARKHWHAFG